LNLMAEYTLIKMAGGIFAPADDVEAEELKRLKTGKAFRCKITEIQNYELLQKIWVFFKFCAQYYYGDENVTKHQIQLTKDKLTMSAGYVRQEFLPDGLRFELYPKSISYGKMKPEEREIFYTAVTNAAMRNIFTGCDEATINRLHSFFN